MIMVAFADDYFNDDLFQRAFIGKFNEQKHQSTIRPDQNTQKQKYEP